MPNVGSDLLHEVFRPLLGPANAEVPGQDAGVGHLRQYALQPAVVYSWRLAVEAVPAGAQSESFVPFIDTDE